MPKRVEYRTDVEASDQVVVYPTIGHLVDDGAAWRIDISGTVYQAGSLLDKTLIVITPEFGRTPEFDSGGGCGHQGTAFTCVLAGGGLSHRGAWRETDELSKKIVANPFNVPDFFATVCAALASDYHKNLYDNDRLVPITDMGQPIAEEVRFQVSAWAPPWIIGSSLSW